MNRPSELTELIIAYGCAERELGIAIASPTVTIVDALGHADRASELFHRILAALHAVEEGKP